MSDTANFVIQFKSSAAKEFRNLPKDFIPDEYSIRPSKVTKKLHHLDELDLGNHEQRAACAGPRRRIPGAGPRIPADGTSASILDCGY